MDKKLQIVQHLYGEAEDRAALRELLEDPEVHEAYQAMSEAKFHLDHRRRQRPEAQVIDRIMEAAATPNGVASVQPRGRRDRAARPRHALRRIMLPALSAAAAVVILVGLGLWRVLPLQDAAPAETAAPAVAFEDAARSRQMAPAPQDTFQGPAAAALSPTEEEAAYAWDESPDVRRLHRRIEALRVQNGDMDWGEPAVPLELLPQLDPNARTGLQQTSTRGH